MKGVVCVDLARCLACRSCELACAIEHTQAKTLSAVVEPGSSAQPRLFIESCGDWVVPIQCRHCESAPCISICPSKAMEKSGQAEPVIIKDLMCIGCKMCIMVCPFGALKMDRRGKVVIKCDLCLERLQEGNVPACVEACPTGALSYKSLEEISARTRKKSAADFLVTFESTPKK